MDRDRISAALPKGITLETPVVPDKMYGESSKTVEDALTTLMAHVQENAILDGGMGREIRFHTTKGKDSKDDDRALKKLRAKYLIIVVAPSGG